MWPQAIQQPPLQEPFHLVFTPQRKLWRTIVRLEALQQLDGAKPSFVSLERHGELGQGYIATFQRERLYGRASFALLRQRVLTRL